MTRGIGTAIGTVGEKSTLDWSLPYEMGTQLIDVRQQRDALIPTWLPEMIRRIVRLDHLDTIDPATSWPLNVEDAEDALEFLGRVMDEDTCLPWVGRLSSGGIALAWTHGDVEVEAVFDRLRDDRELIVSVGDREWDAPVDVGDSLFATVVDRLSNSYIGHAAGASASPA
jgi:hypothetical protein